MKPYFFLFVHYSISNGVSCKEVKSLGVKKSVSLTFCCVKRIKVACVRCTHIIIFSLKWRSQGAFLISYRREVAATRTFHFPPSLISLLINHNSNHQESGKMAQRHYFNRGTVSSLSAVLAEVWGKYWSIKGTEHDDAVSQVAERAPPFCNSGQSSDLGSVWTSWNYQRKAAKASVALSLHSCFI